MKWADWADRAAAKIDRDQLFCEPGHAAVAAWAEIIREEANNGQIEVMVSAQNSVSGGSGVGFNGSCGPSYGPGAHGAAGGGSGGYVVPPRPTGLFPVADS